MIKKLTNKLVKFKYLNSNIVPSSSKLKTKIIVHVNEEMIYPKG